MRDFMRSVLFRSLAWIGLLSFFICLRLAQASDQIALIEDTSGLILPASGICSNLLYPNGLCVPQAGMAFYSTHPDNYDILIFATNKMLSATEKTGYPVKTDVKGIGNDTSPWHYSALGSQGRLLQAVTIGSIQSMPDDPDGIFPQIPVSGIEIIGHEIGHHWMAYVDIDHNDGRGKLDILRGYRDTGAITHWSCWFNSNSVMYGGMFTDNGDGTFTDINGPRKYSYLDQYLMGLRAPEEVGPMWYVSYGYSQHGCADWPEAPGVAHDISGDRVDFTIDDVIRAMGQRVPTASPCHYKVGFAFVYSPGFPPSEADLRKFETYRTRLETWWTYATDGRGSLDTRLDGCGVGTEACAGDVSPQCGAVVDGDADDGSCTFNDFRCADAQTVEICNPSGEWQWIEDCQQGQICEDGNCVVADDGDIDNSDTPIEHDEWDDELTDDEQTDNTIDVADGDRETPQGSEFTSGEDSDDGNMREENSDGSGSGCLQTGSKGTPPLWLVTTLMIAIRRRKTSLRNR